MGVIFRTCFLKFQYRCAHEGCSLLSAYVLHEPCFSDALVPPESLLGPGHIIFLSLSPWREDEVTLLGFLVLLLGRGIFQEVLICVE